MFTYVLYIACSLAGLIMIVGGIWLLAKQKIYLDRETKEPIDVELPGGMKVKANSPALALFLVGFIPLLYPVYKLNPEKYRVVQTANLTGSIDPRADTIVVYASLAEDSVQPNEKTFRIPAHFVADQDVNYKVLLLANNWLISEGRATWKDRDSQSGEIRVNLTTIAYPPPTKPYKAQVGPVPTEFSSPK